MVAEKHCRPILYNPVVGGTPVALICALQGTGVLHGKGIDVNRAMRTSLFTLGIFKILSSIWVAKDLFGFFHWDLHNCFVDVDRWIGNGNCLCFFSGRRQVALSVFKVQQQEYTSDLAKNELFIDKT